MSGRNGFVWGVATAAIQIEGASDARGESIWDRFARIPGAVANGDTPDVACDHYAHWREDVALMAKLGIQGYRFSISWPRVLPNGRGKPSRAGLDFYRRLAEELRAREIEPLATLYHWDLPTALHDAGGWTSRETIDAFVEYAELMYAELGDVVSRWVTHNEPWVTSFLGHGYGLKAPGRRDWHEAARVAHHLLLSHGRAVRRFREVARGEIGIVLDLSAPYAVSDADVDREAARRWDGLHNRWFLDPVLRGGYPADVVDEVVEHIGPLDFVVPGDLAEINEPIDFLGVNYYTRSLVFADAHAEPLGIGFAEPVRETTAMGWEVAPDALHELLLRVRRDYGDIPLVIAENGAAYDDPAPTNGVVEDPERVEFLRRHIAAIERARADGVNVAAYYVWSLLDNFEWEQGYAKRFGIVYVDYPTQRRITKRSALWYRDWIASRSDRRRS
jgi:beta-glucosidase